MEDSSPVGSGTAPLVVDRYGFFKSEGLLSGNRVMKFDIKLENLRLRKWNEMLKNWDVYQNEKFSVLQRRLYKGIPDAIRGRVWSRLAHTDNEEIYQGIYQSKIRQADEMPENEITKVGGVIDRDLHRTFPNQIEFMTQHAPGQQALKRVLRAYAAFDRDLQYTQGMNYIAALCLLYMNEERAFWTMCQIMSNAPYTMTNVFASGLTFVHSSHFIMGQFLQEYLPTLQAHLLSYDCTPALFFTEWMMTVFSRSFPFDIVVRIWDIFFLEGWTVVYKVAIALLAHFSQEILALEDDEVFHFVREIPRNPSLPSADSLIASSSKYPITPKDVERLNTVYMRSIIPK